MIRKVTAPDNEPEESSFKIPSPKEHLMQITDWWEDKNDPDVQVVKMEVIGGEEEGLSLIQRININDQLKSFYYCRLFLKAISESYKGSFDIDPARWIGKQLYCTVKHAPYNGKIYANIESYNFEKKIERMYVQPVKDPKDIEVQW